ncbi:MAG: hypothetical protein WHV66_05920 [Anaerolineales bacterium]
MKRRHIYFFLASLLLISLACSFLTGKKEPTPIPSTSTPPPPTIDTSATQAVLEKTQLAQESSAATQTSEARIAQAQEATRQAEEAIISEATEMAQPMAKIISNLFQSGLISTTEGTFFPLDDFDQSWAQLNWYQWWYTGYQPENFVIHSDVEYWSASNIANWFASGCGYVFRETDADNHYNTFLALDGNVYLSGYRQGKYLSLGKSYYGKPTLPNGKYTMTLVAEGKNIAVLINERPVLKKQYDYFMSGNLAFTLNSGTNKDYGTRCLMTNNWLWILP